MKIWWIRCNLFNKVQAMVIVGDYKPFMEHLEKTSKAFDGISIDDFLIDEWESCYLDPGGMARINPDRAKFTIGDVEFEVDWEKISGVLDYMEYAGERMPGYQRFQQKAWFPYLVVMPTDLFNALKTKLKELASSDEAIQAALDFENVREKIEKAGHIVRLDKIAQMPPDKAIKKLEELGLAKPPEAEVDPADYWKQG